MSPLVSPFVEINGARSDDRCRDFQKTCYKVVVRMSEDLFLCFLNGAAIWNLAVNYGCVKVSILMQCRASDRNSLIRQY